MKAIHIRHLYWRAGFGIHGADLNELSKKSKTEVVDKLFKDSSSYTSLKVDTVEIDAYLSSMDTYDKKKFMDFNKMSGKKSKSTMNFG